VLQPVGQRGAAAHAAREVVADVQHRARLLVDAEHRVERRDPVRLRGRHLQPLADVVHAALADPPGGALQRVQRRQQQRPVLTRIARDAEVGRRAFATLPAARRRPEHGVHGAPLLVGRRGRHQVQLHA
jgi:hypothetical protein